MIKFNFRKKDSHFWMALPVGIVFLIVGIVGTLDSMGFNFQLSWKVFEIYPLEYIESLPWSLGVAAGGLLLMLDACRVFTNRRVRFLVWLYMMIVLWIINAFLLLALLHNEPKMVAQSGAYFALTATYSLLFLGGPPLAGKNDPTWEN